MQIVRSLQLEIDPSLLGAERAAGAPNLRPPPLRWISALDGTQIHVVPIDRIVYFQSDHKYTRVVSDRRPLFIRMPLHQVYQRLDNEQFLRVHRSAIVNIAFLDAAVKEHNKVRIVLRGSSDHLTVSERYHHLFRAM